MLAGRKLDARRPVARACGRAGEGAVAGALAAAALKAARIIGPATGWPRTARERCRCCSARSVLHRLAPHAVQKRTGGERRARRTPIRLPPARMPCCPGGPVVPAGTPRSAARSRAGSQRRIGLAPLTCKSRHAPLGDERRAFARRRPAPQRAACAPARRPPGKAARLVHIGIVRAPHQIAAADARRVQSAVAEAQLHTPPRCATWKTRPPSSGSSRAAPIGGIEHHAVAGLQRRQCVGCGRAIDHAALGGTAPRVPSALRDGAARGPAPRPDDRFRSGRRGPDRANRPAPAAAPAGVHGLRAAGPGFVHRLAVGARGERHVIGVLVAAFDLQRRRCRSRTISGICSSAYRSPGESR